MYNWLGHTNQVRSPAGRPPLNRIGIAAELQSRVGLWHKWLEQQQQQQQQQQHQQQQQQREQEQQQQQQETKGERPSWPCDEARDKSECGDQDCNEEAH